MKKSNKGLRMKTGTYTGNGEATQVITGVGFKPKFLKIYAQWVMTLDVGLKTDQDGLNTKYCSFWDTAWYYAVDHIISLDPDGFTVGDGTGTTNVFNITDINYTYIAFG